MSKNKVLSRTFWVSEFFRKKLHFCYRYLFKSYYHISAMWLTGFGTTELLILRSQNTLNLAFNSFAELHFNSWSFWLKLILRVPFWNDKYRWCTQIVLSENDTGVLFSLNVSSPFEKWHFHQIFYQWALYNLMYKVRIHFRYWYFIF